MSTTANLLVILIFLSGLYTLLGLICAFAGKVEETLARRYYRRRMRKASRRTPRRGMETTSSRARSLRPVRLSTREEVA